MGVVERLFHPRAEPAPPPPRQSGHVTPWHCVVRATDRATFLVSGTTHRQVNIAECGRSFALFRLAAEPTNACDENAVQVLYGRTIHVGYISTKSQASTGRRSIGTRARNSYGYTAWSARTTPVCMSNCGARGRMSCDGRTLVVIVALARGACGRIPGQRIAWPGRPGRHMPLLRVVYPCARPSARRCASEAATIRPQMAPTGDNRHGGR